MTTVAARPGLDGLAARLDDPDTAAAVHDLIDHAELLAMLVTMLEGVLQRGESLTANLSGSLAELRAEFTGGAELRAELGDLSGLKDTLHVALPALRAVAASRMVQPATIQALDAISGAMAEGLAAPERPTGLRGLLGGLRDPETLRGLGMLLGVAKALGRSGGPGRSGAPGRPG